MQCSPRIVRLSPRALSARLIVGPCAAATVGVIFGLGLLCAECRADHKWDMTTWERVGGGGSSVALDRHGRPHLAGGSDSRCLSYFSQGEDGQWVAEEVDSGEPHFGWTSLAFGPDGTPHMLFNRGDEWEGPCHLMYAARWNDAWAVEMIDEMADFYTPQALQVDSQGWPSVVYHQYESGGYVALATGTEEGWRVETLYDLGEHCYVPSLILDGDDTPHITFWRASGPGPYYVYAPVYAVRGPDGWHVETVEPASPEMNSINTPFVIESDGEPRIAYSVGNEIHVAKRHEGTWNIEVVGVRGSPLALASNGEDTFLAYPEYDPDSKFKDVLVRSVNPLGPPEVVSEALWAFVGDLAVAANGVLHCVFGNPLTYAEGRPIHEVASPPGVLHPGFDWLSIPMEPVGSAEASDVFSWDATNRLFRWDAVRKTVELYPDDFRELVPMVGYVLYLDEPLEFSYRGVIPDGPVCLPLAGATWIGIPGLDDVPQGEIVIENNSTGQSRTVAEDATSPDPWMNPNWVYYDNQTKTPRILVYDGSGDDTVAHPWLMYRTWSFTEDLTLRMP